MGAKEAWERIGQEDPYFGVLTSDRFRNDKDHEDFFKSGAEHIERVFAAAQELTPDFAPQRALDFGCGVARLVLPLARRVPEVIGIDVSPGMLAEARSNCARAGVTNVGFCRSAAELDGMFDFIHSFIVFQHIPVDEGLRLVTLLLQRLSEGGVGALHFTYAETAPWWRKAIRRLYKRVPGVYALSSVILKRKHPLMQMNPYPLNRILALLQTQGFHRVSAHFSDHGGTLGVMLIFQRRALVLY
jgi:SAM-dependent methyltransferase